MPRAVRMCELRDAISAIIEWAETPPVSARDRRVASMCDPRCWVEAMKRDGMDGVHDLARAVSYTMGRTPWRLRKADDVLTRLRRGADLLES